MPHSRNPLQHWPLQHFPVVDNCLQVGGIALPQLAARVGQTPFYAYERRLIEERVALLRQTLPETLALHYAIKANPMPAVVQCLAALVDGLDVASLGELRLALDSGMAAPCISFAGPGKRPAELQAALAAGVTIHLESAAELERVAALAMHLGQCPKVAVRVNPDFQLKAAGMKMGGGAQPFGVDAEQVPAMLRRCHELGMELRGLHIFCGSQNLHHEALMAAHDHIFALALRLAEEAHISLTYLNIGGGFGIPYFPGELPLQLPPLAENLQRWLTHLEQRGLAVQVVLELGRYLVGEAGIYVVEVLERKVSRGRTFLITNGGLHQHLAASGNFGQVLRRNYPLLVGNRVRGTQREVVSVVGPLCTPLDVLAERMELARAEVGDLIVVLQSGAYGLSASPTRFLGHPECVEVLV